MLHHNTDKRNEEQCIVIVTPGFAINEDDTTCLPHIQQLILSLIKLYSSKSVIVIAFQYPYQRKMYYWHGVKVICLGGKNKTKLWRLITWIRAYQALKKINNTHRLIGIFSIFHSECALVASKFGRRNNIKHISWLQGQDAKKENSYVNKIKAQTHELATLSAFLQQEFEKNHTVKPAYIIDNGITESAFPELNVSNRQIDILGVGNLIPLKNFSLFIEIIHDLVFDFPNIKAKIVGTGTEHQHLKKQIEQLQLENHIELVGLLSHKETLKLMNDSKIVVHTSNYEGSCSVLIEALYSGCHVVSTCNPSNLSFDEFHYAIDKNILREKVMNILSNPSGQRKRILYNSMDDSAKKIMNLFLNNG